MVENRLKRHISGANEYVITERKIDVCSRPVTYKRNDVSYARFDCRDITLGGERNCGPCARLVQHINCSVI